jgi:hypothetical protein
MAQKKENSFNAISHPVNQRKGDENRIERCIAYQAEKTLGIVGIP